ncbi:YbaL family putative K(+) efflux transporter [Methyloligella sp. 2.7D]|uniref:YbaL family putative K(+) efflux transporter n=1 Tax=unclassified Methyloligella TaxID=2625955 RepID=UPI00157CED75|nr:YbaL family putative K(+) efflux transporter [Methyloligella sp. GL2]QKP78527.1 Kef family K(+) transporter [Methyloligella sp. GL2]
MPHATPLISTITLGLLLAFVFGVIAQRIKLPPLIGYLVAGILVGPFTPGYVADQDLAAELAEMGVILLMFGVGMHFSLKDLLSVRNIAIPGAVVQIAFATLLGMGLGHWLGWTPGAGLVFGLALSVASTVVLLRALQERRLVETERGRIAVGWLIVEDLAMVLALVLLPAMAGALADSGGAAPSAVAVVRDLAIALAKIAAFIATMLLVGKQVIPWLLHYIAHTGSRELFRLSVLVIALGTAFGAAELFDVSFALGAFFAGVILSESALSQHAAEETLPLRDAFAVLFFVAAGMLFDPAILLREPLPVLATVGIIVVGKSLAAYAIVRAFGYSNTIGLTIAASLAQIGEFSFILATLGLTLEILPRQGSDLIVAGAIISILLNPLIFAGLDRLLARREQAASGEEAATAVREPVPHTTLKDHVVLIGHGEVGGVIGDLLRETDSPVLVIEDDPEDVAALKERGTEAIQGNAADPEVIAAANLNKARSLLIAIPDGFEGGQVVEQAKAINPKLVVVARAHSEDEVEHLAKLGADVVVTDKDEVAKAMLHEAMIRSAVARPKKLPAKTSRKTQPKSGTRSRPAGPAKRRSAKTPSGREKTPPGSKA